MSEIAPETTSAPWLTLPELVEVLDEPLGRVKRLLDEHYLVGSRRNGAFAVPGEFIVNGEPLASLRGTVIVLMDSGFTEDETIDWLLSEDDSLGRSPIASLLAGNKSAVRRLALTLG